MRKYIIYSLNTNTVIGKKRIWKQKDFLLYNLDNDNKFITLYKVEKIINNIIFVKLSDYNELLESSKQYEYK